MCKKIGKCWERSCHICVATNSTQSENDLFIEHYAVLCVAIVMLPLLSLLIVASLGVTHGVIWNYNLGIHNCI